MPSRSEPLGLLLDFDGTLADSILELRQVFHRFLARYDIEACDDGQFDRLNGVPLRSVVETLGQAYRLNADVDAMQTHYESLLEKVYGRIAPREGAVRLLERAHILRSPVGIVTSNRGERVRRWLERNALSDLVEVVVGVEDVTIGKPDPMPYELATSLIGRSADNTTAVEDSLNGALAARRAGLRTFVLDAGDSTDDPGWPEGIIPIGSLDTLPELLWPPDRDPSRATHA